VLAITPKNADAAMILLFLYKLIQVLRNYFHELEEESIKDNFVVIYELLDEMMDFGYPQATDAKILKECVLPCVAHDIALTRIRESTDSFSKTRTSCRRKFVRPQH